MSLPRRCIAWLRSQEDADLLFWPGLLLIAVGGGAIWLPAAALVPGVILTAVGLGFTFARPSR